MRQKGWIWKTILSSGLILILMPGLLLAQQYPTKPINVTVTFAAGGTLDAITRVLAVKAEKSLGQPFVISNVGGGAGSVALGIVAKKRPDGYDITSCTSTGLVRIPQLRAVPYSHEDFISIMHFAAVQSGLVVKADSPCRSLKDLVEFARKNPGKVTYSTSGVGTPMHLAMEYIAKKEGIHWTHVPYTGGAPALSAVLRGHVTAMSDSTEWLPDVKKGSLRLLVTHGEKRMKSFPDVLTLRDLGYDFINETVFVMAAPKGTPSAIVKKLDESFHKAIEDPEFVETVEGMEFEVTYRGPKEISKYLDDAYRRLADLMKELRMPKEK